jgi:hypothetical protein
VVLYGRVDRHRNLRDRPGQGWGFQPVIRVFIPGWPKVGRVIFGQDTQCSQQQNFFHPAYRVFRGGSVAFPAYFGGLIAEQLVNNIVPGDGFIFSMAQVAFGKVNFRADPVILKE